MEKGNTFFSTSANIINTDSSYNKRYQLTYTKRSANLKTLLNNNIYLLKSKELFKPEKHKLKEDVFTNFKEVSKRQIRDEQYFLKKKKKELLEKFSILKDANIDEGIVLNKYFAYLKRSEIERNELKIAQLKNMLTPIKRMEKEIKAIRRKINFHKIASNQMLMKHMIENKEQFTQYLKEIAENKIKNDESYEDSGRIRGLGFSYDIKNTNCKIKSNDDKNKNLNNLKSCFGKKLRNTYLKFGSPLKIEKDDNNKDESQNYKDQLFITSNSNNKINFNSFNNRPSTTIPSLKTSLSINKKYFSPQMKNRFNRKNNIYTQKRSNKINYSNKELIKIRKYNINNIFNKLKIKKISNLILDKI